MIKLPSSWKKLTILSFAILLTAPSILAVTTPAAIPTPTLTANTPKPISTLTGIGPISSQHQPDAVNISPLPPINAKGYILMDANTGTILASQNADTRLEPASLTKMMTMYVISEYLRAGKIHLTDNVTISKNAWKTGGSRMFIQVGSQVPIAELVNGIIVVSGNDAAVAMAEYIGGSEDNFVTLMNQTAAQLNMKNTHFSDVNGLPTTNHYSSPHDLAILAQAIINNYPEDYKWYSQKSMEYNNIKQANRNRLLWRDPSVDGLKTGFTDDAGYCLVASAKRNGMRLISVIMGAPSPNSRTDSTEALLNWGFRNYSTHQLYAANQTLAEPRVWFGTNKFSPLGLPEGLSVTIPNGQYKNLKAFLTLNDHLVAPVVKGQPYGTVNITINNQPLTSQKVVALQNNPRGTTFERLRDRVILLFRS